MNTISLPSSVPSAVKIPPVGRGGVPTPRKPKGILAKRDKRCRTGCVGVSFTTRTVYFAGGRTAIRHYYRARLAGTRTQCFCIETLGNEEAFRRAVAKRAQYVREVTGSVEGRLL